MTKKLIFSAISMVMALNPMTAVVRADSGDWQFIQATDAWSYDEYKVEKLAFEGDAVGPLSMGDYVIVAEPTDTCDPTGCDRYNLSVIKDGMQLLIGNVPSEVLDEQRYFSRDEQFMYMDYADDEHTRWNVVVVDLETGEETLMLEDFFLDGVEEIDVMEEDNVFYVNASFNWNNHNGYSNGSIIAYDKDTDLDWRVSDHWITHKDLMQDVQDQNVLSVLEFSTGYTQLWVYEADTDPIGMEAIPDTWTSPDEEIVGAHFRDDGSIEFFRMFERYVYKNGVTTAQGDYLSWYKDTDEALQIVDGRMAWLDAEDTLRVSDADGVISFGTLGYPQEFRLTDDAIFYASGTNESVMYEFDSGDETQFPFVVTDALGDAVVGTDATGSIWYQDLASGETIELGFGEDPVLADESHVYWSGEDGGIYEATILFGALTDDDVRAVKTAGDATVYLVVGDDASAIPSESVFFSWFDSWSDVETISEGELNALDLEGDATFAPGTKVKLVSDPKVYVVGDDNKLHWITTQTVAYNLYGSAWNQDIIEVTQMDLTGIAYGSAILDERDIMSI